MENINTKILIIGAGASGITAAIAAAQHIAKSGANKNVILIEKSDRIGKKILMTGNGKCNLSNENTSIHSYNDSARAIKPLLLEYNSGFVRSFFSRIGLLTKADDAGRIYPYTNQASSVLDVLRAELERLNVRVFSSVNVISIDKKNGRFVVKTSDANFTAQKVIISVGGLASPGRVFAQDIYKEVKKFGHTCKAPFPALVPVLTSAGCEKLLKGVRWSSKVALFNGDKKVCEEAGEVQFTDYGLSGICVFQLSRYAGELKSKKLKMVVDLMPEYEFLEIFELLKQRAQTKQSEHIENLLVGVLNNKLGQAVLKQCKCRGLQGNCTKITDAQLKLLAKTIKELEFKVDGLHSFKHAQVMSGGFSLSEINLRTMESLKQAGLYLTGEMLDVDGLCGGFNLHWAWISGYIAGKSAAE